MTSRLRPPRRTTIFRYGIAVTGVGAATLVRFALEPYVGSRLPYVVFFFAVVPVASYLGVGPSLVAIALATIAAVTFFIPPFDHLGLEMVTGLIGLALFVAVNLVIVWIAELNRIARRRLEREVADRIRAEAIVRAQVGLAEFGRDIGLVLSSGSALGPVLAECGALTVRHLGGDHARIDLVDERGRPTGPLGSAGDEALRSLVERVAAERRAHLADFPVDRAASADRSGAGAAEMVAFAACPLVVGDRLIGIWTLSSTTRLADATPAAMESAATALAVGIERVRAEEGVRIGEARKTAIFETSLDGIITMDHQGRVVEFNAAAERIFGHAAAAVRGRELAEVLMPAATRPAHRAGMARYLATGAATVLGRRIEVEALRSDGTIFPAEVAIARIPLAGPPLFTAHVRDIGDRKRAEEALRAAKREAEDANQAKDRFLAALSHELRTPLNPIALALNSILGRPGLDDDVRDDLELIRHYLGLESRMIDDLLDVMRIARGKMPLRWEMADAHDLVRQALGICAEELRGRSLHLAIDLDAARSTVRADPARLRQVFWNLIKNAVKFTPTGGSLAIRSRNEPGAPGAAADLVIEVADTGIGIEPDVLPRIFEAFQQGDSSINRQFGGLGLGLAICQGVVEGHGGTLRAASAGKGRGTTFTLRLSTALAAAAEREATAEPPPSVAAGSPVPPCPGRREPTGHEAPRAVEPSPRVLLVEDEPATIRLMSRLLRGIGYRVTAAGTVAEAARHVDGPEPFDLIISDIGLPDGTGLDLMRQVQATRGNLPGIALTGFGTDDDIEQSRRAGFAAHLTKPIDFGQLEGLIRHVVAPTAPP